MFLIPFGLQFRLRRAPRNGADGLVVMRMVFLAFVAVFRVGAVWIYYVGGSVTLLGFALRAPTEQNLMKDQAQLRSHGCDRSLIGALRRPEPPTATG